MRLEIGQLTRRYADLRIRSRGRVDHLVAKLAREEQHSPVVVVAGEAAGDYVLIDGYARVEALGRLARDEVEAVLLDMDEAAALVHVHRTEGRRRWTALEESWLLEALIEAHGLSAAELARQLERTPSWVSRRLALVRVLPSSVQEAVRRGVVPAHGAMKHLVVLARANKSDCERLVVGLGGGRVSARELERLHAAWRKGDESQRARIIDTPRLYLKAEEVVGAAADSAGMELRSVVRDLELMSVVCRRVRRRVTSCPGRNESERGWQEVLRAFQEARVGMQRLESILEEAQGC